ncbi:MAG TPA: carboxypeptidase-like regulatory domain-containing protein [Terracidiphilus sp.]|jgi:hypothetical protein|nr:carboxypeptidase-like regulatory domain-containing protein [Terracidiphilus sp.]
MQHLANLLTHRFHRRELPTLTLAVLLGIATCCSTLRAQSGAGSIEGTVTDGTGAVIAGASVNAIQRTTNAAFSTKTNQVGFYQVPSLFAGVYDITVVAPNMKTYKTSVQLLVAQNAVVNPMLTAGSVTQQVEVVADTVQLTTTDNGTIASTLENSRINQLPMNGRALVSLVGMTTPGLEPGLGGVPGARANGLMAEALEYVADGVPLSNRQFGGEYQLQAQLPDPDSVEEVRVETTNTSAQYTTPGTTIITTKSGTNALHGALFETARNNAIGNARPRTVNYILPHLVRNEFGASVGGPFILPHLYNGKDKSFWFFAFEKYSLASSTPENVTVPTTAMRGGDFSGLINSAGQLQQLYDPTTTQPSANCNSSGSANAYCRTPFLNNQIPIGRLSPTSKMIYDITAQPGTDDNPLVESNLSAPDINDEQIPTVTFRLDHVFNENNRAYLRYTSDLQTQHTLRNYPSNSPATVAADGFPDQASGVAYNPTATFAGAIGFTHVFSPTFFSETIVSQQWFGEHNYAGGTPFADFEAKLGLPNNFGEPGFPNFGSTLICPYGGTQFIYGLSQIVSNFDENLTKTIGHHQLQFGGRYRHERFGDLPDEASDSVGFGNYATGLEYPSSGTNYTPTPNTGYADGDMFLGAATGYSVNHSAPYIHFHDMEFDAYLQDNYRVTSNLTLNIGLRWEAHPATWEKNGMFTSFDLKNDAMVLTGTPAQFVARGFTSQAVITNLENDGVVFETPQQANLPSVLLKNYDLMFSPRVGLAYTPFGGKFGTVIRGAYGRYIYPVPTRNSIIGVVENEPFEQGYSQSYTSANQSPDGAANYLLRAPQTVIMGVNSSNVVDSSTTNAILPGFSTKTLAPNYAPDLVTETNFTVEQPFKGNSALRVSWVWTHGTNLDRYYYYNHSPSTFVWEMQTGTAPPTGSVVGSNQYASTATGPYNQTTWGNNSWLAKDGWSNDNSLQVNYQRLFHHGVAYQMYYVWSKAFRVGGNSSRDGLVYTAADYLGTLGTAGTLSTPYGTPVAPALPPSRPTGIAPYADWHALSKFEAYILDSAIPMHHIGFNGIVDLPFGRGKRFIGSANRFVDEIVGGFQIAGDGSIITQNFQPAATNWGSTNPLKVYKHKARLTDCRSGVCRESFEWFNGYIAPTVINAASKGISGLPANYLPYETPVDNTPGTTNYGNNNVVVTLANGTPTTVAYSPGPAAANPFSKTFLNGPINYTVDLSIFKVFPITEKVKLRFNADAFNALNVQGYNNPNTTDGTESLLSSYNVPRQIQLTLRLQF